MIYLESSDITIFTSYVRLFLFELFQIVPPIQSCCFPVCLMLRSYCFWHAGCAGIVPNDACLDARKAHARYITVFKDGGASGETKTVQRMNAIYCCCGGFFCCCCFADFAFFD